MDEQMQPGVPAAPAAGPATLQRQLAGWTRTVQLALLAIIAGLAALFLANLLYLEPRVEKHLEGTRSARLFLDAMLDTDAAVRGHLITGDAAFLRDAREARARVDSLVVEVERAGSSSRTRGPLLRMRLAQELWLDWAADALRVGAPADDQPLAQRLAVGRERFFAFRQEHGALTEGLVAERDEAVRLQSYAIAWTTTGALLLALATALLTWRRGRQLRASTARPLHELQRRLALLRHGEPLPDEPLAGPAELVEVDDGLRDAARALAETAAARDLQAARVAQQNRHLEQVLRVAREIAGSLNLRYVVRGVAEAAAAISDQRVVIWLRQPAGTLVEPVADTTGPGMEPVGLEPVPLGDGPVGRAARFGRIEGRGGLGTSRTPPPDAAEAAASVAIPMVVGAQVIGVLETVGAPGAALDETTVDVLHALAVQAASGVASARAYEHTEQLARTDALTQLPNRRQLDEDLAIEATLSARHGRPLAFAMLDVDHFKAYNDTLGHQAGDAALQQVARLLAAGVRAGDRVYRFGGEELAIVMRETEAAGAAGLVDRLRAAVEHHFSAPGQPRVVTFSAGVAAMPADADNAEQLVAAADEALYEAKRGGRNQVRTVAAPA